MQIIIKANDEQNKVQDIIRGLLVQQSLSMSIRKSKVEKKQEEIIILTQQVSESKFGRIQKQKLDLINFFYKNNSLSIYLQSNPQSYCNTAKIKNLVQNQHLFKFIESEPFKLIANGISTEGIILSSMSFFDSNQLNSFFGLKGKNIIPFTAILKGQMKHLVRNFWVLLA
ncbi:unnamed protein product [Paramecium primaurelia]|uniref:Uncharacterized protein n=1 Tax=Paramecium primaurelia TaxID=5886 RepID=A0A8S1Q077_PARPR|nr:unnamed protein product [Paramecium primaurelia]